MPVLTNILDAASILHSLGPWTLGGIGTMVFIESGVLFPFLPGDSLLVTAAALHVELGIALWAIILVAGLAAILGDQVGFYLGHRYGRRLFKDDARVLKTDRLAHAEAFFERRGPLALVLGRFVPIVRTYVPVAAGTAGMPYRSFAGWNIGGAVAWVCSMVAVGALLGQIPGITKSIDGIMILIIVISVAPIAIQALRARRKARRDAVMTEGQPGA